jgi:hypothetical protein
MASKRKRKAGRPAVIGATVVLALRVPPSLRARVRRASRELGVSASEGWRQAALEWTAAVFDDGGATERR